MKRPACIPRHMLLTAARMAYSAHPDNAQLAHQVFLRALENQGVRVNRLPEMVSLIIQGALDRSLGDARIATGQILKDMELMSPWVRMGQGRLLVSMPRAA